MGFGYGFGFGIEPNNLLNLFLFFLVATKYARERQRAEPNIIE